MGKFLGINIVLLCIINGISAQNDPATGVSEGAEPEMDSDLNGSQVLYEEFTTQAFVTLGGEFDLSNAGTLAAIKQSVSEVLGVGTLNEHYTIEFDNSVAAGLTGTSNTVTVNFITKDAADSQAASDIVADSASFASTLQTAVQSNLSDAVSVDAATGETVSSLVENELNGTDFADKRDAALDHGASDQTCDTDQYVDGYNNGQGISLNYEATNLKIDGTETKLEVHVNVPFRYHAKKESATFALTWHDRDSGTSQAACYTNRDGYSQCDATASDTHGWSFQADTDNPCIIDYTADFNWADIVGGNFRVISKVRDGGATNYIMTLDTERWTYFEEKSEYGVLRPNDGDSGAGGQYSPRTQGADNDPLLWDTTAGWNIPEDSISIRDERYEFEQIPFILRFQDSVEVSASLTASSPITILKAIVEQEAIEINYNPDDSGDYDRNPDGAFARVDVVLQTQVQYPYAVRGVGQPTPASSGAAGDFLRPILTFVDGQANFVGETGEEGAAFKDMGGTDSNACRTNELGDRCTQRLKYRFWPKNCIADAELRASLFVECNHEKAKFNGSGTGKEGTGNQPHDGNNGCAIDDIVEDGSLTRAEHEESNAFFTFNFKIRTGNFCPTVIDEVSVEAKLEVYHDELFNEKLTFNEDARADYIRELDDRDSNEGNLIAGQGAFVNAYSNDILYFLATYRTRSADMEAQSQEFVEKSDEIIDFTRATAVYLDVKLPLTTLQYRANYGSETTLTINAANGDITGDFNDDGSVNDSDGDGIDYRIQLCGSANKRLSAEHIQEYGDLDYPTLDCFTEDPKQNALKLLDAHPLYNLAVDGNGDALTTGVGEKDIALSLRLDERLIPVNPVSGSEQDATGSYVGADNDKSNTRLTIEAEVYYKGNKHPSRRRLQTDDESRRPIETKVTSPTIFLRNYVLSKPEYCDLDEMKPETHDVTLWMMVDEAIMPNRESVRDWSTNFAFQLGGTLGMKSWNQIKVNKVITCDNPTECEIILDGHDFRRLGTGFKYMRVGFSLDGDKKRHAGFYANWIQKLILKKDSDLYNLQFFKHATVKNMKVAQCDGSGDATKEISTAALMESSATSVSLIAGFLASLVALFL